MGSTPEAAQVREAMETVASFAQFEVQLLGDEETAAEAAQPDLRARRGDASDGVMGRARVAQRPKRRHCAFESHGHRLCSRTSLTCLPGRLSL